MSIQTINGSIISNYPVFEGSQVLTSEQLNGMFDYLDQQNRFTRSRLIGIGIVCGLHIRTNKNDAILSEGIGITSDGFIVKMPECTMSYQRDYFLPSTVAYEAFGSYDNDNIFTQDDDIILYELLHSEPTEGQYQNLTKNFLEDKYLLIFLECFDRDPRSCLGKNCEDLGKERIFTTRKLAVDKKGLNKILSKANGSVENPFFPASELIRIDLKKPIFNPDGMESKEVSSFVKNYKNVLYTSGEADCVHHRLFGLGDNSGMIQETWTEFQPLLEPAYNYQDPFSSNAEFENVRNALRAYLDGSTGDNLKGVQYVYEFYELLIDTYHEFMNVGAKLAQECCPEKDFSLHLIIGKIAWDETKETDEWGLLGRSRYRHQFLQPKILNSQSILLKELISIHKKLLLLVASFQVNVIKEKSVSGIGETIKITPIDPEAGAIPRYLIPQNNGSVPGIEMTTLETEWHFDTTITGKLPIRVRSYDRNRITDATLFPVQNDYVTAPLNYRTSLSTYKAEAIFGEPLDQVMDGESKIRDTYHLPFTIVPVKINPEPSTIVVEPHYWQDLQTAYNVTKGELNVTFKNLIAYLKEFERAAQEVDFGLTAVNMYNFKVEVDHVLSEISAVNGLVDQANELVQELPIRIEAFYDNGALPNPFQIYYDTYRTFRRNLHKAFLRLWNSQEILVREKIDVLEPELFQLWRNWIQRPVPGIKDFLSNNDFYQLHKLYYAFALRYQFLQKNHYSILCNFLRLHPGIDFNSIRNDGTHVLVYDESEGEEGVLEQVVFANFSLPYRLDPHNIEIPLDEDLENEHLPPLARGEAILLQQGQMWLVDSTANDLEPNGDTLRVDQKGSINDVNVFRSGLSFNGAKVVSHGGVNSVVLRYEPPKSFTGADHFQYTVESESDSTLQDTAYVEVLVVPPYRKHIKAVDDLAATNNIHSVDISILDNDRDYPGTQVNIPPTSDFGAELTLLGNNQVRYTPVYGREGKDTFKYTLQYEFATPDGPQIEVSEAKVEVIVFCCNRMEFEVICEGNQGEFQVLTDREIDENAKLILINGAGDQVENIALSDDHYIQVQEKDGVPYLFYHPDLYFKGKETYVYEVTDSEGFMRRVKFEILVMPCTKTFLRRVLCDSMIDFEVLEDNQKDLFVYTDRNNPRNIIKTAHGEVKTDGVTLRYNPERGFAGLDFFEFGYQDDQGVTHYHTMQVIVECCEKVRLETICRDAEGVFVVLSPATLKKKYVLKLYHEKGKWVENISTQSGGAAEVSKSTINYKPQAGFIGLDSFQYAILKEDSPEAEVVEYGKFYVIVDANRKVQLEYTFIDNPKDLYLLSKDQLLAGATLSINTSPSVRGATAQVISDERTPYIRYAPARGYIGQDSFGYVITIGDVRICGTVYMIVDAYERIEIFNVLRNKPRRFNLYSPDQEVTRFEILRDTVYGQINVLADNELEYHPEKDFLGNDKMRYRATVDGEVKHGKVFFLVTCDCDEVPDKVTVEGRVTDNTQFNPSINDVRVEEVGTGTYVMTQDKGGYQIDVAPGATLRFSKDTHNTLIEPVSGRTIVDVELVRKEVTVSGVVRNANTSEFLQGVDVTNFRRTPVETSDKGRYTLLAYAGFPIDYELRDFVPQRHIAPNVSGVIDVDLEPINTNTGITISGTVFEDFGGEFRIIEDASYELDGRIFNTSAGNFSFTTEPGTEVFFMAPGFLRRGQTMTSPMSNARVILFPEGPDSGGQETKAVVSGTVYEEVDNEFIVIKDASYEIDGKIYSTSLGNFSFTVEIGTEVFFMAPGFQRRSETISAPTSKARVILFREGPNLPPTKRGTVEGRVTDGDLAIQGVRVIVKGANDGTFTEGDGKFSLAGVAAGDIVVVVKDGYIPEEIQIGAFSEQLEIVLRPGVVNPNIGDLNPSDGPTVNIGDVSPASSATADLNDLE